MTTDSRPARPLRRYPVLGGAAGWSLPLVALALAAWAVWHGALDLGLAAGAVAWGVHAVLGSLVVEVSPRALTRGVLAAGTFRGPSTVIPWSGVADIHTAWCRPGDDSALETFVRDGDGRAIRISTGMGLAAYWTCLGEIARRAPDAPRSGVTDAVLADGPPARHHLVSAGRTAAALALVLVAVVALHYVWAQGRSSLARSLDASGAAPAGPAARE
jgi:hypothetical protein